MLTSSKNIALIDDAGSSLTYSELIDLVGVIGQHIEVRGLLLLKCDNSISSILFYVACLELKVPVMLIDDKTSDGELESIIEEYKPYYIVIRGEAGCSFGYEKLYNRDEFSLLVCTEKPRTKILGELALLLSTSGSTGSRKFVRLSYANICANTDSIIEYLNITEFDVAITTMPMSYTFGLSIINSHLSMGAKIVLTKYTTLQREFWDQVSNQKVTSLSGVPYLFEVMIKTGLLKRDLPNVKTITQAGGKLNAALKLRLLDYCEQSKKKLYVMYGQTEATARMSYVPPDKLRDKIDSIGISVSGGALEVLSDDGVALQPYECGEIVYTGANVSLGYAEKISDLNLDDTLNGKLYTGDVGYRDEDGFFFVVGRNKRFAKVFGLRLSLDELEDLLVNSFPHLDFMCKDNEGTIEIFFSGTDLDINDATKIVSNSTKINRSAFKFKKISHIPRNDRGKKVYGN